MQRADARAGSVASVRRIKNVSRLAKTVMEKTNHVMIVGAGAAALCRGRRIRGDESPHRALAKKSGSRGRQNLLSTGGQESIRRNGKNIFQQSSTEMKNRSPTPSALSRIRRRATIPCMAVDSNGDISATTTTSGIVVENSRRVGDSPIIGAGCCVDNEVGAAGSTGKGEENIKISGGHTH